MKPIRDGSEQEQAQQAHRGGEPHDEPEHADHDQRVRESVERMMELHDEAFRRLASP